jgi:phosphoribosyl-AMP cyclohydrolase
MKLDELISKIKWNDQGLVPAIAQDEDTKEVLMMAWMNEEALRMTVATRKATYYSRSRQKLWIKGETSGNVQELKGLFVDCDTDTLLITVKPAGPACHTGQKTCFYTEISL